MKPETSGYFVSGQTWTLPVAYTYDKRGGVTQITTPSGNTDYTHDAAGRVSTRTYANNIKTSYTYDTTGRVSQMKFEDINQLPVLLDQYDYTYTGLNQQYVRTETTGAVEYRYQFDKLRRMTQERKRGTGQGNPLHYQKDFTYDKAGNRASYQHQNGGGQNYGRAVNYDGYSYDMMGRLTQIQDSGRNFTATVTNDMNGNITEVTEVIPGTMNVTSTFAYDNENRLTEFTIGLAGFSAEHTYDGFNRLIKTDATVGLNTTNYEHTYAGKKHLGNIDVTNEEEPVNGKVWRWEGGAGTPSADPIETPQRSSQSGTQYYTINDEKTIEKRSYQVGSVTAGDTNDDSRYAEWQHVNGAVVPTRFQIGVPSELFSAYNISLDADRASSAATNHALQLGATDLEYEVTRVKSPVLGRDMNPLGRGDGTYYMVGDYFVYGVKPIFEGMTTQGYGNSINNDGDLGNDLEHDPCANKIIEKAKELEMAILGPICVECQIPVPDWHPWWYCYFARLLCCLFTHATKRDDFGLLDECDYRSCYAGYPWRACCTWCSCLNADRYTDAPCDRCDIYCEACFCPPLQITIPGALISGSSAKPQPIPLTGTIRTGTLPLTLIPPNLTGLINTVQSGQRIDYSWRWCWDPPECPNGYLLRTIGKSWFGLRCHYVCDKIPEELTPGGYISCAMLFRLQEHAYKYKESAVGNMVWGCLYEIWETNCEADMSERKGKSATEFVNELKKCCLPTSAQDLLMKIIEAVLLGAL